MRIAIVGAGSIGGAIAHALALTGHDPVVVARGATKAALERDGFTVTRAGSIEKSAPRVVADPAQAGVQDMVIGALKAHDWPGAADLFAPMMGPDTLLLPAINGLPWWYFQCLGGPRDGTILETVDPGGILSKRFDPARIVGTVVYMAVSRPAPGQLAWPTGERLVIGDVAGGAGNAERAAVPLRAAGLNVEVVPDIRNAMWLKLVNNASFNPISVLTRAGVVAILDDPHWRAMGTSVMREIMALSAAAGCAVAVDVEARLESMRRLGDFKSSMLQDFEAGRSMEIGPLVEAPRELGRLTGVATPVLDEVSAQMKAYA
jgi:2-dehydropantoate 2-reductase